MKQAILDTSFILTCVRQKIDFFEQFELQSIEIIIPKEVTDELEKLNETGKKYHIRQTSKIALRILEKNNYEEINLSEEGYKGDYVDQLIIDYSNKNNKTIVAVLDREIKDEVKNPKAVIRGNKNIDVI